MEDILAIVLILAGVASVILAVRWFMRRSAEKAVEEAAEIKRQLEATRKWRETMFEKSRASAVSNTKAVPKKTPAPAYYATPTSSRTSTTTSSSSSSSDGDFVSGMLTGMLIDNVVGSLTHKSGGSNPIDFPKVDSSPSWGFDDDDSRKSASSSFSSSDSSSSWSSSSSDSGPSSDW